MSDHLLSLQSCLPPLFCLTTTTLDSDDPWLYLYANFVAFTTRRFNLLLFLPAFFRFPLLLSVTTSVVYCDNTPHVSILFLFHLSHLHNNVQYQHWRNFLCQSHRWLKLGSCDQCCFFSICHFCHLLLHVQYSPPFYSTYVALVPVHHALSSPVSVRAFSGLPPATPAHLSMVQYTSQRLQRRRSKFRKSEYTSIRRGANSYWQFYLFVVPKILIAASSFDWPIRRLMCTVAQGERNSPRIFRMFRRD